MQTGTVWGVTLLLAGFVAALAATQIVLAALFPARHAAVRRAVRERPWTSGLAGLPAVGVLVAGIAVLAKVHELAGALASSAAILVAAAGLGGLAAELGARFPSSGAASTPWRGILRGSVAASLASLLPVAGWFVVFPVTVLVGTGAFALSMFRAKEPAAAAPSLAEIGA